MYKGLISAAADGGSNPPFATKPATQSSCALSGVKLFTRFQIAVKVMFAVCGVNVAFCFTHKQFVVCKKSKEFISSHEDMMLFKKRLQHDKEFSSTTSRLIFSYKIDLL